MSSNILQDQIPILVLFSEMPPIHYPYVFLDVYALFINYFPMHPRYLLVLLNVFFSDIYEGKNGIDATLSNFIDILFVPMLSFLSPLFSSPTLLHHLSHPPLLRPLLFLFF